MAEDGVADYRLAKRKAARQLGFPEHTAYPDNAEVEAELRAYRSLYQEEVHPELIRAMRQSALRLLELLADYSPHLAGSVLDGTAGEHSHIDILLFAAKRAPPEMTGVDAVLVTPRCADPLYRSSRTAPRRSRYSC